MHGYLRDVAWFRRRDAWFVEEQARREQIRCIVCIKADTKRHLELHHLDYTGVRQDDQGRWVAGERHEDLVAAHPRCHEWIHTVLDRDTAAASARDRRAANVRVIRALRAKIAQTLGVQAGEPEGLEEPDR
ncbi:hypothetical protein [Pseudactinotalea sp. Z1748]|uniref:hypothetical protein n=1 Tax=Pseudactinotalea sp. Z1748 TaxID=3413027 RepID=UPI003C7B95CD